MSAVSVTDRDNLGLGFMASLDADHLRPDPYTTVKLREALNENPRDAVAATELLAKRFAPFHTDVMESILEGSASIEARILAAGLLGARFTVEVSPGKVPPHAFDRQMEILSRAITGNGGPKQDIRVRNAAAVALIKLALVSLPEETLASVGSAAKLSTRDLLIIDRIRFLDRHSDPRLEANSTSISPDVAKACIDRLTNLLPESARGHLGAD